MIDVIYADPPWRYEHCVSKSRAIENQYPTMSLAEICAFTLPPTTDAVLFLWATSPKLADAMPVITAKLADAMPVKLADAMPVIIENVPAAAYEHHAMRADLDLDGYMFGLRLDRHRVFECSFPVTQLPHVETRNIPPEKRQLFSVVGRLVSTTKHGGHERYEQMKYWWPIQMGLPHIPMNVTTWDGHNAFSEAIPPAFSKYIIEQFIKSREARL